VKVMIRVTTNSEAGEQHLYSGEIQLSVVDGEQLSQKYRFKLTHPDARTQRLVIYQSETQVIFVHGPMHKPTQQTTRDLSRLDDDLLFFLGLLGPTFGATIRAISSERQAAGPGAEEKLKEAWAAVVGRTIPITLTASEEEVHEVSDPKEQSHIISLCQRSP
jgi:hypothetical protein